jgi:hypothetical protein
LVATGKDLSAGSTIALFDLKPCAMKLIRFYSLVVLAALLSGCSKDDGNSTVRIAGEWAFTNQSSQTFSYPGMLLNPYPVSVSSWAVSNDSIRVNFDRNGTYTFLNFRLPVATGQYHIVKDSLLVIAPDNSGFLKFCFSTPAWYASTGTVPVQVPYANYHFTSDTLHFKTAANNIVFTSFWINIATVPIQPGGDTVLLTQANSSFRKL